MYEFIFSDYRGSGAWNYNAQKEAEARKRGTVFAADQLRAILAIWAAAAEGQARHSVDRLTIPSQPGAAIIQPNRITFEKAEPNDAQMRASMAHMAEQWGGQGVIPMNPSTSREFRLRARAYAEVYGIRLDDANEAFRDLALTKAELARLPELRASIRRAHADAPPMRQNEDKAFAAMYAARNPYRAPAPA